MISLLCLLGWHRRSRGRARRDGLQWISRCRRCNAPMRRNHKGKWRLDRTALDEAEPESFSDAPEADPPRQEPRQLLLRIRLPQIHIPLPFRKVQD